MLCDENAHKDYGSKCERNRMINISQALGIKTIFIRYNPDDYKVKGVKQTITKKTRQSLLLKVLDKMLKQKHEKIDFLSVIYMYYDDFDNKKILPMPIDIFEDTNK